MPCSSLGRWTVPSQIQPTSLCLVPDHDRHDLLQCVDCIWRYYTNSTSNDVLFPRRMVVALAPKQERTSPFLTFLPGMSPTGDLGMF